jgi:hypothetical protein
MRVCPPRSRTRGLSTPISCATSAARPALRVPALAFTALFYVLHALVHVTDTLAGRLPPSHWAIDLPGVYLPAAVLVVLTGWAWGASSR